MEMVTFELHSIMSHSIYEFGKKDKEKSWHIRVLVKKIKKRVGLNNKKKIN